LCNEALHNCRRTELLYFRAAVAENRFMPAGKSEAAAVLPVFVPGTLVLVTLNNPREKFWGAILDISPAGLSLRGIDLNSFDEFAREVKAEEPAMASAVFFPMHRVERMELDATNGEFPSLAKRFLQKTGKSAERLFDARRSSRGQGAR
jgi:hypothetical protein